MASAFRQVATGGRQEIDAAEVRRALAVLADPAHGVFLQSLPSAHWACPPGDSLDRLVREVERLSDGKGTYVALNPCPAGEKVTVGNVVRRRRVLFDFDPVRVDGGVVLKDANSTDDEHDAAREAACRAMDYLTEKGWPLPVGIDSGNGAHLVYAVDLPNDAWSRQLVRAALGRVAELFDTAGVKLGVECCDARRITKLPGTKTRKGPHSKERPQRWAKLVYVPDPLETVTVEMLRRVAADGKEETNGHGPAVPPAPPKRDPFKLNASPEAKKGYVRAAVKGEAARVVMAPVRDRNNAVNKAAYCLGGYVHTGLLSYHEAQAELELAASMNGVLNDEPDKTRDTIKRGLEAGMKEPRAIPEGQPARPAGGGAPGDTGAEGEVWSFVVSGEVVREGPREEFAGLRHGAGGSRNRTFEVLTIGELLDREFDPPQWCVPGLLAEGLNLLVGSPKTGKSFFALNLALTVAAGGYALGNIKTVPGDVLYLSLEDQQRRVRARAAEMMRAIGRGAERRLSVATDWPRMDQGGLGLIEEWIRRAECPRLVIVDVLGKFRPMLRDKGNAYEQDSQHMYAIKQLADESKVTIQAAHHTRKAKGKRDDADDEMETISGTQGLAGGADGIILLHRLRHSNNATISMTSRDSPEQKLAIEFDRSTLTWKSLGSAEEHLRGQLQAAVLAYMKARPDSPVFPSQVADQINANKDSGIEANADKVRVTLNRLAERGLVARRGMGWVYPGVSPDTESF